jgi:O-antigen ligase
MSILPFTPLKTIFISEFILVFAVAMGVAPQEFSYLILLLLIISFIKLNKLDSLKLFIISIPFFVVLPANQFSDSMSIWRILIIILFLKICHSVPSDSGSESINSKGLSSFQFVRQGIKRTGRNNGNIQKILKQVQNGNYYKLFLLITLFFIIAAISLISAQDVGAGVKKILFLLNIFLLFPIVILSIKNENDFKKIIKFIFYSTGLLVFIGYLQFILTFFVSLLSFWQFWAQNIITALSGQNLSNLLSYSNTWFSYYEVLPATLRMFSLMPDSHSFAMLVIISIPAVLSLIYYYTGKEKKYLSLILIFSLLAIFFSGSRGAWVGSVFALMAAIYLFAYSQNTEFKNLCKLNFKARLFSCPFFKWLIKKIKNKNLIKQIAFFKNFDSYSNNYFSKIIISSVLLFFILMPVSSFVLRINQEIQLYRSNIQLSDEDREKLSMFERTFSISDFTETSNKGRLQIWSETLTSISKHPFLGIGFGNFPTVLGENVSTSKMGSSAHSTYLDIVSEIGIFGLIVFLLILIEILKTARDLFFKLEKKYLKIFAGSFFVYFTWVCAYGIFDVVIFNDKVLIVVVIMIAILYSLPLHNPKKM